jgi:hypothetical protein
MKTAGTCPQVGPITGTPQFAMVQGTARTNSGDHTVGYKFKAFRQPQGESTWIEIPNASGTSCFYAHSGNTHGLTPMVFLQLDGAMPGDTIGITVQVGADYPNTNPSTGDYFSIAVAELDQQVPE